MIRDLDLDTIFCLECERIVSNDNVIRYNNQLLQLETGQVLAGAAVRVQEGRNGRLRLVRTGETLRWRQIEALPPKIETRDGRRRPSITIPPPTHPWKQMRTVAPKAAPWK